MSLRAGFVSFFLRHTVKREMASFDDHHKLRGRAGASIGKIPAEVLTEPVNAGGANAEWVRWQGGEQASTILYLHGGGYVFGGLDSHRGLAWRLAKACAAQVLVVDYRLAPEHPFPAAVDDALLAYQWLLEQGVTPAQLTVAGDSAGGGLALALMLKVKEQSLSQPQAAVLLSPWADLTLSGASIAANAAKDAMLSPGSLEKFRTLYLGDADPASPYASPMLAELSGLPPTYVVVGSEEVLYSDAEHLVQSMRQAGCEADLAVWPKMPHVFPLLAPIIPEGAQAIEDIAAFVRAQQA